MKKRVNYYIEPKGMTLVAVGFMVLAIGLRLFWCLNWPEVAQERGLAVHVFLPLTACVLFVVCLLGFGKKHLWLSFIPAVMGVLFFLLKATTFVWWHQLLCTLLYLLVAALYGLTVFGIFPIRRLLIPLFGLPLCFHIFVEDAILHRTVYHMTDWFQEWSVLAIMAGLLCLALSMKERTTEDTES
jgi:hypothetical protein